MAKRVGIDKWLFIVTILLVFFGLIMVFSASAVVANERYGSPYAFVLKQAGWALLGLMAMVLLTRINYRRFNTPSVVFPCVAVVYRQRGS
jgi:cell division protein FtsW